MEVPKKMLKAAPKLVGRVLAGSYSFCVSLLERHTGIPMELSEVKKNTAKPTDKDGSKDIFFTGSIAFPMRTWTKAVCLNVVVGH